MQALDLREHIARFKSEADYHAFIAVFAGALQRDSAQIVLNGRETICTALSPDAAQEVLYYRLREAVRKRPDLLDEIKEGLQDEDLVDAPRPATKED